LVNGERSEIEKKAWFSMIFRDILTPIDNLFLYAIMVMLSDWLVGRWPELKGRVI
jgi:hypothetical protein